MLMQQNKEKTSPNLSDQAPAQRGGRGRQNLRSSLRGMSYAEGQLQLKPDDAELKAKKTSGAINVAGTGSRKTYVPNRSNGKTLYFFYGLKGSSKDKGYRDTMDDYVEDDVAAAVLQGFTVTYDRAGTKADFLSAIYDSNCFGVYWCGHGYMDGTIQDSDGHQIRPEDVDKTRVSSNIQYLILAACGSGLGQAKWKAVMGAQCRFQGWVKTVSLSKVNDFTTDSFLDSLSGHEGINASMELDDYIATARNAKRR